MAGGIGDLLGSPRAHTDPADVYSPGMVFSVGTVEPGKIVDLSAATVGGASSSMAASSLGPPVSLASPIPSIALGSSGFESGRSAASSSSFSNGPSWDRSISSLEGGGGLSLAGLTPANIIRQLTSRPMTELVRDQSKQFLQLPRMAASAYSAAARRYLRPWTEFMHLHPGRIAEAFRRAQRRGEVQIYIQRNVVANTRRFCPNYVFVFLATLFMFVCTSPVLLATLSLVGGGWSHALRSEEFRNRPWQLQIGAVQLPLGQNMKMLLMALPTLIVLHFFMGPVLWSAALCSGGASVTHAALRDREDDQDNDDHGLGSDQMREV